MKVVSLILTYLLYQTLSEQIYPKLEGLPVQWINEGFWLKCSDKSVILAQNCDQGNDKITECYQIPMEGLCTKDISVEQSELQLILKLKSLQPSQITIFQDENSIKIINLESNQEHVEQIPLMNIQNPLSLKLAYEGEVEAYLLTGQILSSKLQENCLEQGENFQCKQCGDNYFMYFGECIPKSCIQSLQTAVSQNITSKIELQGQDMIQTYNAQKMDICILPRLTQIKNFDNLTPIFQVPKQYLSRPSETNVTLKVSISDLTKFPCARLETDKAHVTQCYMSFEITMQGATQYQYITLFRILVNKDISTQITYNQQDFTIPDKCCESIEVNVLSDIKLVDIQKQDNQTVIVAQQSLRDPQFKDEIIQFQTAYIKTPQGYYPLKLLYATVDRDNLNTVTYNLAMTQQLNDTKDAQLVVQSNLVTPMRFLQGQSTEKPYTVEYIMKENIPFILDVQSQQVQEEKQKISDKREIYKNLIEKNQEASKDMTGLFIFLLIVLCIFFAVVAFIGHCSGSRNQDVTQQQHSTPSSQEIDMDKIFSTNIWRHSRKPVLV